MKIEGIIWFDEITEKRIVKHHVSQDEVREVFANKPHFRYIEKEHSPGEDVYAVMSQTNSGRYLIVFFVYKRDRNALILSARNMTRAERRKYGQR
ncbi:MAG: BrnT family toxin [Proteobacteria bacterium]|nr:BrnT family toxin [Pseudomonadota bacterium]